METGFQALGICLIAEPDRFIAQLLIRFAEEMRLTCVRAKEGEDLLALARQIKPHVIILDAEFPGDKIGWEILRSLKADAETRHIRLISCSWLSQAEVYSLGGQLAGHLQKPDISYDDFEAIMKKAGVIKKMRKDEDPSQLSD